LAFVISRVEVVAAVNVDLDCALDARYYGHPENPAQGWRILGRNVRHARAFTRSA
jgi:hypothetical protein